MWGYDPEGGVELLARTGELFEVAPGDWRTISSLGISSGSILADGDVRGLTDAGQFAFRAWFDDGSEGIFLATIPSPVPEPGALTLLAIAGLTLLGLVARRRKR